MEITSFSSAILSTCSYDILWGSSQGSGGEVHHPTTTRKFLRFMGRLGFRVGVSASYSYFRSLRLIERKIVGWWTSPPEPLHRTLALSLASVIL